MMHLVEPAEERLCALVSGVEHGACHRHAVRRVRIREDVRDRAFQRLHLGGRAVRQWVVPAGIRVQCDTNETPLAPSCALSAPA